MNWISEIKSAITRFAGANETFAGLAVFGKHPGWNDHLDDIGVVSEALIAAKQILYVQGIGGVVDSGQWDSEAENADILPAFRHLFYWADQRSLLVGRLWSSSDGKGRTKYPMIACIHLGGRTEPGIPDAMSLLESMETRCKAVATASEVISIVAEENARAKALITAPAVAHSRKDNLAKLGLDPASDDALRIAYAITSYITPLAQTALVKSAINLRLAESNIQPQHVRLPAVVGDPDASFQFWRDFIAVLLPASVPQLFLVPLDAPWVDIIIGQPSPKLLACLKIGSKQLPLNSEIPYTIDGERKASAEAMWRAFLA